MTEPLSEISRIKEAGRKSSHGDILKHEKLKRHPEEEENNSVDISEEARNRSSGKRRRNILEYIENQRD